MAVLLDLGPVYASGTTVSQSADYRYGQETALRAIEDSEQSSVLNY